MYFCENASRLSTILVESSEDLNHVVCQAIMVSSGKVHRHATKKKVNDDQTNITKIYAHFDEIFEYAFCSLRFWKPSSYTAAWQLQILSQRIVCRHNQRIRPRWKCGMNKLATKVPDKVSDHVSLSILL